MYQPGFYISRDNTLKLIFLSPRRFSSANQGNKENRKKDGTHYNERNALQNPGPFFFFARLTFSYPRFSNREDKGFSCLIEE